MTKKSRNQKLGKLSASLGKAQNKQEVSLESPVPSKDIDRPKERKLIVVLILMAVLSVSATIYLLGKDKKTTTIELEAITSSIAFELATQEPGYRIPLLSNFELESLDIPNFKKAVFFWTAVPPDGFENAYEASEMESLGGEIIINQPNDFIGIDEMLIPDKTKVELNALSEPREKFQLALKGDDIGLNVQIAGSPTFSVIGFVQEYNDCEQRNGAGNGTDCFLRKRFEIPAGRGTDIDFLPITYPDQPQELVMNFTPKVDASRQTLFVIDNQESVIVETRAAEILFGEQIDVSNLSLTRINESQRTADGSRVPRRVSAIETGTLYLEELDGKAITLRPGEQLQFEVAKGTIRKLMLQDGLIKVQFRGTVEGMRLGFADSRSLMPSWLQYILAREGWLAVLGGIVTALFLLSAFMQSRGSIR